MFPYKTKKLTMQEVWPGCIGLLLGILLVVMFCGTCTGDKVERNQYYEAYEAGKNTGKGIGEAMRRLSKDRPNAAQIEVAAQGACPAKFSGEAREGWIEGFKAGY